MKKKKKEIKHGKRNFGIFLIILQLIALIGTETNGNKLPNNLFGWVGFLLPGIIGVILIIKDNQNEE